MQANANSPAVGIENVSLTSSPKPSRLWWWFVAAFVVQAAVWTAWFTIAAKNKVTEVPLVTTPAR